MLSICLMFTGFAVYAGEKTISFVPGITLLPNGGTMLMDGGEEDYEAAFADATMELGQTFGEVLELDRIISLSKEGEVFAGWMLYDVF